MAPEDEGALSWPIPRRNVTVLRRELPAELVVVAGVYAVSGVWLLWQMWAVVPAMPDVVPGLFSDTDLVYSFTYLAVFVVAIVVFLAVALVGVAVFLLRADPVGRGLSVVVFAALVAGLGALSLGSDGWFVVVLLVAGACCATLFISPWCREVFAEAGRADGQPSFVVLSRTLLWGFFSLMALEVVVMVPGLRFLRSLGPHFLLALLILAAACALAWPAQRRLLARPRSSGRWMVTGAAVLALVGLLLAGDGFPWVQALVLVGMVGPLWGAKEAPAWFADADSAG